MTSVRVLRALDDAGRAERCRHRLALPPERALALARETLAIVDAGGYRAPAGRWVDLTASVAAAVRAKSSLAPDAPLPAADRPPVDLLRIQVANATTTEAARPLLARHRVLALNFANAFVPGGGFLGGACAQEESLCRAGALYRTLEGDAMYACHARAGDDAASDHAILSPDVPFVRDEDGALLETPYALSVLTCAAPVALTVGRARADEVMGPRIERVLAIAAAHGHDALVLGAWGCGAFGGDPAATARRFRDALTGRWLGAFAEVVFAIADWSPERRFLGPFRDVFGG